LTGKKKPRPLQSVGKKRKKSVPTFEKLATKKKPWKPYVVSCPLWEEETPYRKREENNQSSDEGTTLKINPCPRRQKRRGEKRRGKSHLLDIKRKQKKGPQPSPAGSRKGKGEKKMDNTKKKMVFFHEKKISRKKKKGEKGGKEEDFFHKNPERLGSWGHYVEYNREKRLVLP